MSPLLLCLILFNYSVCLCGANSESGNGKSHCEGLSGDQVKCTRGCKKGYRGPTCTQRCPENCAGACDQDLGNCLTGCKKNWFTANCSKPCSGNCVDDVCDSNNGECMRGCKTGFYGLGCNITCGDKCIEGKCDIGGGCRCKKDVFEEYCYIDCGDCIEEDCGADVGGLVKCRKGCKAGHYGTLCKEVAEDRGRRKRDIQHCHEEDGNGKCLCCEDGWRGPKCDIQCPACRYSLRHNCTLSCRGGFFGAECHLPCPRNCSRATDGLSRCNGNGVCDSGCLQGYYGSICQHTCPTTCLARTCFMNNGSCIDGCVGGTWGPKCDRDCGHCLNATCERDGTCTCTEGYYGPRCEDLCSDNCQSGNCSIDRDGNHFCVGECQASYTGNDCLSRCPRDCYNSHCTKTTGLCDGEQQVHASSSKNIDNTSIIAGATCGTIAVLAIVAGVLCCSLKRRNSPPSYEEATSRKD